MRVGVYACMWWYPGPGPNPRYHHAGVLLHCWRSNPDSNLLVRANQNPNPALYPNLNPRYHHASVLLHCWHSYSARIGTGLSPKKK